MDLYQKLIEKAAIPLLGRIYNPSFGKFRPLWAETQYWDRERLLELRWQSFMSLLKHTAKTVPFYRDFLEDKGLTVNDFKSFEDLALLPVVSKSDMRKRGIEDFLSSRPPARKRYRDSTSGTSGTPFEFFIDDRVIGSRTARLLRENEWANWLPGTPYLRLWGPHEENWSKRAFYNSIMRRHEVSAFSLYQSTDEIFRLIQSLRPRIVEAYTSAAVDLARICQTRDTALPSPESIIVSAETLLPEHRDLIESTLGGKVFNRYGSREFGNIAHECEEGRLHINAESFYLEVEPNPHLSEAGNLLVTFFDNYTMPFIRYRIGDLASTDSRTCTCGRTLPLLGSVEGRETDFFSIGAGRTLTYLYFNHFFEQYGGLVDRYQVAQTERDHLLIRLVTTPSFSGQHLEEIKAKLRSTADDRLRFTIEQVDSIEREPSGKMRIYKPWREHE